MKRALDLMGHYYGGVPRKPLKGLNPEKEQELKDVLRRTLDTLQS